MSRFLAPSLMALSLALPAVARADLYGYVDSNGQVHLAPTKVDERYQLFQKSPPAEAIARDDALRADAVRPGLGATLSQENAPLALGHGHTVTISGLPEAKPRLVRAGISQPYNGMIGRVARELKLDAHLLHAIVSVESGYDPLAVSPKGAIGLMQLIPETGERFGLNASELINPQANIRAGARYLKFLLAQFNYNLPLVIAAYNAGEGAVQKYKNTIPPYPETRNYVARVMATYQARSGRPMLQAAVGNLGPLRGQQRVSAVFEPL